MAIGLKDLYEKSPLIAALLCVLILVGTFGTVHGAMAYIRLRSLKARVTTAVPPSLAEWLIALLVPQRRSDAVLGDLEEHFQRNIISRGLQRARALYWAETLRSIGPILWMKAKQLGVLALVAEIWRRSRM
jgi:hypothetical protein